MDNGILNVTDNERLNQTDSGRYAPEYLLASDAFVGPKRGVIFESKLDFLANFAKEEQWDFHDKRYKTESEYPILQNYLFFTYDTGLQSREREEDIFAVFEPNLGRPEGSR